MVTILMSIESMSAKYGVSSYLTIDFIKMITDYDVKLLFLITGHNLVLGEYFGSDETEKVIAEMESSFGVNISDINFDNNSGRDYFVLRNPEIDIIVCDFLDPDEDMFCYSSKGKLITIHDPYDMDLLNKLKENIESLLYY